MGQYWMMFNLTRGTYLTFGVATKMLEFCPYRWTHVSLAAALRPGGAWSGQRLVLSGDYDTNRGHTVAYLRARGLALAVDDAGDAVAPYDDETSWPPNNLYYMVASGPFEHTVDKSVPPFGETFRERAEAKYWKHVRNTGGQRPDFTDVFEEADRQDEEAMTQFVASAAREQFNAVSHDARQRLLVAGDEKSWMAFMCLLAESSGGGGGDIEAPFRGDWAAHSVAVLSEAEALALGYEDITAQVLTPAWLRELEDRLR